MPPKPILMFPAATVAGREDAGSRFPREPVPRPTKEVQARRLAARFDAVGTTFGVAQVDEAGIDPEQVIVLETMGSVADFQNVVKRIDGMEWLGDFDAEVVANDPGFLVDGADASLLPGRVFVVASNRTAYNEVLRLWAAWN